MRKLLGIGVLALGVAFSGSALAADGAAIFKAKCSPCHGAEGQGTAMAPAFKGNAFLKDSKVEDLMAVVKNGREGAAKKYKQFAIGMPAQKTMADEDVKAVVEFEKSIASK
ncbi:MAG: cytochrome c [Deltaproteobacteria bacterium]|nr:cytochrome c [Deltaproteobacteria bacterium]